MIKIIMHIWEINQGFLNVMVFLPTRLFFWIDIISIR